MSEDLNGHTGTVAYCPQCRTERNTIIQVGKLSCALCGNAVQASGAPGTPNIPSTAGVDGYPGMVTPAVSQSAVLPHPAVSATPQESSAADGYPGMPTPSIPVEKLSETQADQSVEEPANAGGEAESAGSPASGEGTE